MSLKPRKVPDRDISSLIRIESGVWCTLHGWPCVKESGATCGNRGRRPSWRGGPRASLQLHNGEVYSLAAMRLPARKRKTSRTMPGERGGEKARLTKVARLVAGGGWGWKGLVDQYEPESVPSGTLLWSLALVSVRDPCPSSPPPDEKTSELPKTDGTDDSICIPDSGPRAQCAIDFFFFLFFFLIYFFYRDIVLSFCSVITILPSNYTFSVVTRWRKNRMTKKLEIHFVDKKWYPNCLWLGNFEFSAVTLCQEIRMKMWKMFLIFIAKKCIYSMSLSIEAARGSSDRAVHRKLQFFFSCNYFIVFFV